MCAYESVVLCVLVLVCVSVCEIVACLWASLWPAVGQCAGDCSNCRLLGLSFSGGLRLSWPRGCVIAPRLITGRQ